VSTPDAQTLFPDSLREPGRSVAAELSNQKVTSLAEDAEGHLWIGTFRGLNRYDGSLYHQYFCNDSLDGLPDNQVNDVFCDRQGRIWVATVNGVCRYTDEDRFHSVPIHGGHSNALQLLQDRDGRIYLNTVTSLYVYQPEQDEWVSVLQNINDKSYYVRCYVDDRNRLWIVNTHQVKVYDCARLQHPDAPAVAMLAMEGVTCTYLFQGHQLWLVDASGLHIWDTETMTEKPLPAVLRSDSRLVLSQIDQIHPLADCSLLIHTSKSGMFCYRESPMTLWHQSDTGFPINLPDVYIQRVLTDSQGNVWMGSYDQGLAVDYHTPHSFNPFNYLRNAFEGRSVQALTVDAENRLWISTLFDGLYLWTEKRVKKVDVLSLFPGVDNLSLFALKADSEDQLWMISTEGRVVCARYVAGQLQLVHSFMVPGALTLVEDTSGGIWIGTSTQYLYHCPKGEVVFHPIQFTDSWFTFASGLCPLNDGRVAVAAFALPLYVVDPQTEKVEELPIDKAEYAEAVRRATMIPSSMHEDRYGQLWIGTVSNGLLCYQLSSGKISRMEGASCSDISSIEEDAQGKLWVSSQYGLNKYDPVMGRWSYFYASDGLGGNQFYDRSSCRMKNGMLVFGGTHGLTFFNPLDIQQKTQLRLAFEDLKIHNQWICPDTDERIDRRLSLHPEVNLTYRDHSFSVSWAALDFSDHERAHYVYCLEGFDREYTDAGHRKEAYYANVPAGSYVLRVKAMNQDHTVTLAEDTLVIHVAAAPWTTPWAYALYTLVAIALVYLFVRLTLRNRAAHEAARLAKEQQRAEQQRAEQEEYVNRMNMNFFANVSHEFRTPLTMISGPVDRLCEAHEISEEHQHLLHIVQRSTHRMLRLVNQLMDFNKLENDTLKLEVKRGDMVAPLTQLVEIFKVNATNKGITLQTQGLEDTLLTWMDEDKVDKMVGNLLSNALKFTPTGGRIELTLDVIPSAEAQNWLEVGQRTFEGSYVKLSVMNTGSVIQLSDREKIFERFYQTDPLHGGAYHWGTGIGLYYARSLVRLHHGFMRVEMEEGAEGPTFVMVLPMSDEAYPAEEHAKDALKQVEAFPIWESGTVPAAKTAKDDSLAEGKPYIVVVDDDTEVAHYLQTLLQADYRVACRFDVNSALDLIRAEVPDLILSDVVMPGRDGYSLCQEVKSDLQVCHIPVVLVTACATTDRQVEGLSHGADAYVTKPFDPRYLLTLIHSLLENRERVRHLLNQSTQADEATEEALSPQDNAFMTDLYRLMEQELANPELDVTRMTELMHISRTKFYYKVKGLTGENPSVFFRTYKLNRAAQLISEGHHTMSEVADITGFSTPSHFSKSFKKQFGVSPSEYR
jgi:signal transduction histidine kinase/ligand-binding sensor domain-containing protein/DNA-binding response OmpR family regulator